MALLKLTAFAKLAGVSRPAIYKAVEKGQLTRRKNGKLDTKHVDNAHYLKTHGATKINPPKPVKKKQSKKKSVKKTAKKKGNKNKNIDLPDLSELSNDSAESILDDISGDGITRSAAELQKIKATIEHTVLKIKRERQELIDRSLVESLIAVISTIDTNELLTIPANVAPEIAGICGKSDNKTILKITQFLSKKTYAYLEHKKRILTDWLKRVDAEVSKDETK